MLLHGTSAEFCKIYIELCRNNEEIPTPEGFLTFLGDNENETFGLIAELIFNFVLAIYVQKLGARCNDKDMIKARRYKFLPFFYAFHHPIYQDKEFFDLDNTIIARKELKDILIENITFTSSMLVHNHQGDDFVLGRGGD